MNATARTTALRVLAPLALMVLIFILSAQPGPEPDLAAWEVLLRKLAHLVEFGALTLLWAWALRPLTSAALPLAAAVALLYAVSDEYHQTLVAGRSGTARDVLIDALGIGLAVALLRYHPRVREEARRRASD